LGRRSEAIEGRRAGRHSETQAIGSGDKDAFGAEKKYGKWSIGRIRPDKTPR
jgi:hypothetical protein